MAKKTIKTAVEAKEVMTIDQLKLELTKTRTDLTDAKRGLRLGELTNPRAITVMRKKIARLLTAIRAEEIATSKGDK